MKTVFKKIMLGIVMMLVLCGTVCGQSKSNAPKKEKWLGTVMGFSYHTKTVNDWKTDTYYLHAIEFGPRFGSTPLFANLGLGVDFTHTAKEKSYYNSWNLHVPLYLGAVLGDTNKFHGALRGGCIYNCMLQQFHGDSETNVNSEVDWQLDERSSWFGSFRVTAGYNIYCLFVQYDIPINSKNDNNDGLWRFGICFGL